ncbi:hypothetical protein D3C81_1041390 [compost metagenome]
MGSFVEREVEQLGLLQVAQTVVDAAVDVDDLGVLLDQGNRRQEARTLQAVLVQAVRDDVGGGHQGHAVLEQLLHQGAEDHRVGNVGDEEFVEADNPRLVGETLGNDGQRVLLALEGFHFLVHALHEAVEVRTHLLLERQRLEEGIDQVGLAAPYPTPEVQALDRGLLLLAEQLAEHARLVVLRVHQVVVQALQVTHRSFLRRVMEEVGTFQICLISF